MIKSILMSCKRVMTDLSKVATEDTELTEDSCCLASCLPVLLLKKHIKTAPRVTAQTKTKKSTVVPLVLPPCNNNKTSKSYEKQKRSWAVEHLIWVDAYLFVSHQSKSDKISDKLQKNESYVHGNIMWVEIYIKKLYLQSS